MGVADLELCRELYEHSGWKGTSFYHDASEGYDEQHVEYSRDGSLPVDGGIYPAYDLGFILRKLPAMIEAGVDEFYLEMSKNGDDDYTFAYVCEMANLFGSPNADTPENAAVKLAIELFKQKILVKDKE